MDTKFVNRFSKKDIFAYLKSAYGERFVRYREDWQRSTKGEFLPEFPLCLNYEILDACNLRCIHCAKSIYSSNRGKLGFELFKKTIDEGVSFGLPSIKIGFAEPFMEKEIFKMIEYAHTKGIMDIIVTTNGTLINEDTIEKILRSGITFLRISVDASTSKTYCKIRGGKLNELEKKIKTILIKREEKKFKLPLVRLSFVVMDENKHEIEIFKAKWLDTVDFIDFQDYINPANVGSNAMDIIKSDFFCPYPWQMIPVMANGDIRACCSWYGESFILGNVKETTIKETWDSSDMNRLRKLISNRTYLNDCARCVKARNRRRIKL